MSKPVIASRTPFPVEVEAGRKYFWCRCGRSANQPFCDGAHKETDITPLAWTPQQSSKVFFCGCKQTGNAPLCDGSHNQL